ncbi:MAG: hypothetical protein GC168_08120 [Candidatus Hydrogenedens sp.]|nr:hypothetical protein [Candidatus Hydrogenedens sp.]
MPMFPMPDFWPRTYVMVGCVSFLVAVIAMPLWILVLRRFGALDEIEDTKIHDRPTPRGGGVILWLAFAAAVLLPGYRSDAMNGVLLGSFICLLVGAADDFLMRIPGVYKLVTLFVVTLLLERYGVRVNILGHPVLDTALTLLWIVGVTSAFNGVDNMDGLAAGLAAIAASMFFVIALQAHVEAGTETSLSWFGMMAIGLIGACLGFLVYNFRPALIFMGDSGSFFLGFTVAALGVMGEWTENRMLSAMIPVLILGVPLFDFAYIVIVRIIRGETKTLREIIDHCAPDHLSHRLVWIGFSQRKAVLFIYVIAAVLGIAGVLLRNSSTLLDGALALLQGLMIVAIIIGLMANVERRHRQWVEDEVARFNEDAAQLQRRRDDS